MTLKVLICVPRVGNDLQGHEARVDMIGTLAPVGHNPASVYIRPGEERELHVHSGMLLRVSECKSGTADDADKDKARRVG